jgi:signal peptidase II
MYFPFVIFVLLDQITKALFASRDFFILGLHLHPVKNYALPFGIDFGGLINFTVLFFVYLVVGWFVIKNKNAHWSAYWSKSIFLAGAASNLADRLYFGYVRDFIDLRLGFVFNLADIFIVVGLLALVLLPQPPDSSVDNTDLTGET